MQRAASHDYCTNSDSENGGTGIPGSNGGTGILACSMVVQGSLPPMVVVQASLPFQW